VHSAGAGLCAIYTDAIYIAIYIIYIIYKVNN